MARNDKRRRTHDEIQALVAQYKTSGLSQAMFARQFDVSQSVLSRWIQREQAQSPELVRVEVKPRSSASASTSFSLEIIVGSGHSIRVWPDFDEETLTRVLKVLGQC